MTFFGKTYHERIEDIQFEIDMLSDEMDKEITAIASRLSDVQGAKNRLKALYGSQKGE